MLEAAGDVAMEDREVKRLREVAVQLIGEEKGNQLMALVGELGLASGGGPRTAPPVPSWARGLEDRRHLLRWDDSQYIGTLGVNGKLVCCIVDTGAHRTVIDT